MSNKQSNFNSQQKKATSKNKAKIVGDSLVSYDEKNKVKEKITLSNKQLIESILCNKINLKPKNEKQKYFLECIDKNEIFLCNGTAGIGKSFLSIAKALQILSNPNNNYDCLYLVKPLITVGNSSNIGFLKGTLAEKIEPYFAPVFYLIDKLIGTSNRQMFLDRGIIKLLTLEHIRGMNIDNAILLLEESQNISKLEMKTLLTRIGFSSKYIIYGDLEQCDAYDDFTMSGFYKALTTLTGIDGITTYDWKIENDNEIIRNPIIGKILKKYDKM